MTITPHQRRILSALAPYPADLDELAGRCAWHPTKRSIYSRLRLLEDKGLVRRSDERRDGSHVWQLTGNGRDALKLL